MPNVGESVIDAGSATPASGSSASAPLRPPWPLAKRLNRNALTVAAALAGVTVLTVIVVTSPARSTASGGSGPSALTGDVVAPIPAHPAFLDQPPRTSLAPQAPRQSDTVPPTGAMVATTPAAGRVGSGVPTGTADGRSGAGLPVPPMLPSVGAAGTGIDSDSVDRVPPPYGLVASGQPQSMLSAREQAYQAALTSSVMVGAGISSRAGERSAVGDASRAARDGDPGAVRGEGSALRDMATVARFDPAGSPYTVRAGTLIPGLLLTGVNSDLPGEVLGQTSRDVFDSRTERTLLIPKGSRLIGTYDNRSVGTGRLIVSWVRLILPDGRGLALPKVAATDERGQAGLHDEVDHHFGRVYGAAVLTSVLSAGIQLSQPQQSGLYSGPSARQVAAGALGQNLGDVSLETARRGLDVAPTIVIRPGEPFNVFLTGDVAFDGPYETSPSPLGGSGVSVFAPTR